MAAMGRPKAELVLTDKERSELQRYARRRSQAQALAQRARIVLKCATGLDNVDVAEELGVHHDTVCKWRGRFVKRRLEGLLDEPRPGVPRSVGDDVVERIVDKTLRQKPRGATHWSTRLMAKEMSVSRMTVARIWEAFGLQPHRTESFSFSKDPQFVEKVRDIVGLYLRPPDNAVVLCADEKSQIQALDRGQPVLPMVCTQPEKRTHNYVRHGTTSLFAALDIATGRVIGKCFRKHRAKEFVEFLKLIESRVPEHVEVHLVLDNYATHKTPAVKKWLQRHPRFHLHFTPTSASWLNLVESWFSLLSRRRLKRGVHRSTRALEKDIREFLEVHNEQPTPFIWTKTADEILSDLARYCEATIEVQSQKT